MRVYIAGNFAARHNPTLQEAVEELKFQGHEITSRWLTIYDEDLDVMSDCSKSALMDEEDIKRADILILFAEQFGNTPGRGKYFELGFARALGKIVGVVTTPSSRKDMIFYDIPAIVKWATVEDMLQEMKKYGD